MKRFGKAGGRHRDLPARMSTPTRLGAAGLLLGAAGFAAATWPTAAVADAPVQTGWWNAASGGGQTAPSPSTPAGGLHIAVQPGAITAYGAVLYALPQGATATLELKVAGSTATPAIDPNSPSTAPAMNVQACPMKDASWKAGDDQSFDAKPAYDCTAHSIVGSLSADGKTLTFLVDSGLETVPGQLNLAILPVQTTGAPGVGTDLPVDATQPFSLDIAKPDATSLMVTSLPPVPSGGGNGLGGSSAGAGATGSGGGTGTTGSTGTGAGTGSFTGGTVPPTVNVAGGGQTTTTADSGATPVVAPTNGAPTTATTAANVTPTKSNTAHNVALALLVLLGLAVVATNTVQVPRTPRRLGGGGGRHAAAYPADAALAGAGAGVAAGAAGPVVPAAAMPFMSPFGNRGLGRFAKPRTTPPRPLV
jgi:hypothetical protein